MADVEHNLLRTRTRNLFVISSAIIVYLLAGADIGQLAAGVMKSPPRYPEVLKWAAVAALLWFWWRYFIVWLEHRSSFENEVRVALRQSTWFQNFFQRKLKEDYADSLEYMELSVSTGQGPTRGDIRKVHTSGTERLRIVVHQVDFYMEMDGIRTAVAREDEGLIVDIPWWRYFGLVPFVAVWQALRKDSFGNVVLPHLIAVTAIVLVGFSLMGIDPAGAFGFLGGGQVSGAPGIETRATAIADETGFDKDWVKRILDDPVALTALLVSALAVGFTIWRGWREIQLRQSRDYLDASTRLLERAFLTFEEKRNDEWEGLPTPDRWLWLTVARMLRESDATAQGISIKTHLALFEHARSFWRGKMYDLLRPLESIRLTYFAEDADAIIATSGGQRSCISDHSLRVVLDFVEWPKDKPDPLGERKRFDAREIDQIRSFRYRAVGEFLDAQDAMTSGEDSRKEYWRQKFRDAKDSELPDRVG